MPLFPFCLTPRAGVSPVASRLPPAIPPTSLIPAPAPVAPPVTAVAAVALPLLILVAEPEGRLAPLAGGGGREGWGGVSARAARAAGEEEG